MLNNVEHRFSQQFLDEKQNTWAIAVFCKALVVFVIVKIIVVWSVSLSINDLHIFIPSPSLLIRILFSPAGWASDHLSFFYSLSLLFLGFALFIRWNSFIGVLFFLLVLNLYRVNVSIANGADYVLLMLAFWAIGMGLGWPSVKSKKMNIVLILIFNVSVLLCQLQIVFIYLISGWDKLMSEVWRSGDAMSYIYHLDFLYNGNFRLPESHFINRMLSWLTIVFELAFVILIWFNRTRLMVLGIGLVFHLIIWFMLSLPDFALIMMISYLVFLKDEDYQYIRNLKFKTQKLKT